MDTTTLLIVALVGYALYRRFTGEPLEARRLVVLPIALVGMGLYQVAAGGFPRALLDLALLGSGALIALAGGVARGLTVRVFVRDGHAWQRYTWVTALVWAGLALLRFGQYEAGIALGADPAVLTSALVLALGLSFVGEAAVVGTRALATGARISAGTR
ncbi:hypothetical protein [Actinoplanes sp. NPDC051851]|uniref:hypothetical protein n=1 Tax=Actinoplanes sp. NPDC051851 TaxID=3154753 RepID=UPI003436FACF